MPLTLPLTHVTFLALFPAPSHLTFISIGSSLAVYLFWAAVACCVVAQAAIVRGALRVPSANVTARVPRPRRAAEVAWVLVPAVVLTLVLAFTWRAIHKPPAFQAAPTAR